HLRTPARSTRRRPQRIPVLPSGLHAVRAVRTHSGPDPPGARRDRADPGAGGLSPPPVQREVASPATCEDGDMRLPARYAAAAVIGIYNLIQNRALPAGWYVPGNLVVSAGLVGLARRDGCSWEDLGLGG